MDWVPCAEVDMMSNLSKVLLYPYNASHVHITLKLSSLYQFLVLIAKLGGRFGWSGLVRPRGQLGHHSKSFTVRATVTRTSRTSAYIT